MVERSATVWHEESRVGRVRVDDRGLIHFRYDADWLEHGFPLSLSIPLATGSREIIAHGFFAGLLPEGANRLRICRKLGIDPVDDAGLLLALGEDVAGAFSIASGEGDDAIRDAAPQPLDDDLFAALVQSRGQARPATGKRPWRFSLAGAQEKLPVRVEPDGSLGLPSRHYPSTHILKFETISHVCLAEYITQRLATRLGLPAVEPVFHRLDSDPATPYLLIPRYDRMIDADAAVHRLHQEDIIQALGLESALKYEADGGPGLAQVAQLLRDACGEPLPAVRNLLDWQLFNVLIGNFDGHGKNLALLYRPGHALPALAPFYDLIAIAWLNSVHPHAPYSQSMAFRIGNADRTERIRLQDWHAFGQQLGIRPRRVLVRLRELAEQIPAAARAELDHLAGIDGPRPIHESFHHLLESRCRWFLQQVQC